MLSRGLRQGWAGLPLTPNRVSRVCSCKGSHRRLFILHLTLVILQMLPIQSSPQQG